MYVVPGLDQISRGHYMRGHRPLRRLHEVQRVRRDVQREEESRPEIGQETLKNANKYILLCSEKTDIFTLSKLQIILLRRESFSFNILL